MSKKFKAIVSIISVALVLCILGACTSLMPQSKQLIGKWADSTGTCGYEFKDDGKVTLTFADFTIPVVNLDYTGTIDGVYTTSKDDSGNHHVVITYTLFTSSISSEYIYKVDKSSLTLTSVDGSNTTILIKQQADAGTTAA